MLFFAALLTGKEGRVKIPTPDSRSRRLIRLHKNMNKKFSLYLAPILLAGCVPQQPNMRRELPTSAQAAQLSTSAQQAPMTAPPARPLPATPPAAAPVRVVSAQTVRALEDTVVCRVPLRMEALRTRLEREGVVTAPAETRDGLKYRLRTPVSVYGLAVKDILFSGNDESDAGQVISVTVEGNIQSAVKTLAAHGLRPKRIPKTGDYGLKTKNGSFDVIAVKADTIIGCSVGWD